MASAAGRDETKYYEGPLDQKNGKWCNYWSLLKGKWLYFYKDRSLSQTVSTVAINGQTLVKVTKTNNHSYQFEVQSDGVTLRLRCATTQERTHWMDGISRCSKGELPSYLSGHRGTVANPKPSPLPSLPQQPPSPSQPLSPPLSAGPTSPSAPGPGLPSRYSHVRPPAAHAAAAAGNHRVDGLPIGFGAGTKRHGRRQSSDADNALPAIPVESPKAATPAPPLPGEEPIDLNTYSWFFSTVPRERSEQIIKSVSAVGAFLIRQSSTTNSYSLSFQDEGRIRHYLISQQTNGKYALTGLEDVSFVSLPDLVKYYIEVNEGWAKPLNKADYGIGEPAAPSPAASTPSTKFQRPPSRHDTNKPLPAPASHRPEVSGSTRQLPASARPPPVTVPPASSATADTPRPPTTSSLPAPPPPSSKRPQLVRGQTEVDPRTRAKARQQQQQRDDAPPAPSGRSRPPMLTRGQSDLDFSRVKAALQSEDPNASNKGRLSRAMSVQVIANPQVTSPTALQFHDNRRQQLFPESGGAPPPPNPSVPARSAISLGQNVSKQPPPPPNEPYDEGEDYISTEEIKSRTDYLNHEFQDTIDEVEDEDAGSDYLDLEGCGPAPPPSDSPASPPSVSPQSSVHSSLPRALPPKPEGQQRQDWMGRSSPLYDHVS